MAWNIAISPGKSIFMNMFMMWMMGNAINIWTIFMVFMLFNAPIAALLSIENSKSTAIYFMNFSFRKAFSRLQKGEAYLKQKFVFVLVNLLLLTLAVYKCTSLGLIPNASADWLEFVQPPQVLMKKVESYLIFLQFLETSFGSTV